MGESKRQQRQVVYPPEQAEQRLSRVIPALDNRIEGDVLDIDDEMQPEHVEQSQDDQQNAADPHEQPNVQLGAAARWLGTTLDQLG